MNAKAVFRIVFFSLFIVMLVIRGVYGLKAHRSGLSASFDGGQTKRMSPVGLVVLVCMFALFVFYAMGMGWPVWIAAPLPDWLRWAGAGMGALSYPVQLWVHHTLQEHWSAASEPGDVLITEGPYRRVRHPMYAALMLLCIGLALVSAFWPFLFLALAAIPFFHHAAAKEEGEMIRRFGSDYREYMTRTGRFVPRAVGGRL